MEDPRCIASSSYDQGLSTMTIIFVKRGSWKYFDVPQAIYDTLIAQNNSGHYFNSTIRPAPFEYIRLSKH